MSAPVPAPERLDPCPFCGGEASANHDVTEFDEWSVDCSECSVFQVGESKAEAIAAWNRRATPEAPPAGMEALRREVRSWVWSVGSWCAEDGAILEDRVDEATDAIIALRAARTEPGRRIANGRIAEIRGWTVSEKHEVVVVFDGPIPETLVVPTNTRCTLILDVAARTDDGKEGEA